MQQWEHFKRSEPIEVGNMGTTYFLDAFRKEEWDGQKWPDVKRHSRPAPKSDRSARTRRILIGKSGGTADASHAHLRSSVNNSLEVATFDEIKWAVPQKYAKIQNEGGRISHPGGTAYAFIGGRPIWVSNAMAGMFHRELPRTKPHGITIPKRQFMGYSRTLTRKIYEKMKRDLNNIMQR